MKPVTLPPSEKVQERVLEILEAVLPLKIGLSEDDSVYDLSFLSQKLALCSATMEKLSEFQLALTRINMDVINATDYLRIQIGAQERGFKDSDQYKDLPRDQKSAWVHSQVGELKDVLESWQSLKRMVSEVKEAVGERVQTIKRLDSDIRLHKGLIEAKVAAGAASADNSLRFDPSTEGDIKLD